MQLFDIRSDRQIIASAIKAFKIRNGKRFTYTLKKKKKTHPGLSLEAFVGACITLSSPQIQGDKSTDEAVNREASHMEFQGKSQCAGNLWKSG